MNIISHDPMDSYNQYYYDYRQEQMQGDQRRDSHQHHRDFVWNDSCYNYYNSNNQHHQHYDKINDRADNRYDDNYSSQYYQQNH